MNKLKNNKAFTIVELIVVIAVLGILMLLAIPKFLGYTSDAKISQIKNDIKAYEVAVEVGLLDNEDFIDSWNLVSQSEMDIINSSGKMINKRENIVDNLSGINHFIDRSKVEVKSKLKGDFIWTSTGEVIYYDKNLGDISQGEDNNGEVGNGDNNGGDENIDSPIQPPTEQEKPKYPIEHPNGDLEYEDGAIKRPDGIIIHPDDSVTLPDGSHVPVATDEDFIWKLGEEHDIQKSLYIAKNEVGKGYYEYIGEEKDIVIPDVINGHNMTSYYRMFMSKNMNKVVSLNKNIQDTSNMFINHKSNDLDLSYLDTSNVKYMRGMFQEYGTYDSQFTIKLNNYFKTSKVEDMSYMFYYAYPRTLDLSSFDTSNVINMSTMFAYVVTLESLDLSSFNTSKVENMSYMFERTYATTAYATSESDANKLNSSSYKHSGLNFEVN